MMREKLGYQLRRQHDDDLEEDRLDDWRPRVAPGKQTLTGRLDEALARSQAVGPRASGSRAALRPSVQRDAAARSHDGAPRSDTRRWQDAAFLGKDPSLEGEAPLAGPEVHSVASRGVAGSGGPLPHQERIQAAFGQHDISGVRAHVGGAAAQAASAISARAYTTSDQIAFASAPDLRLAAHEAAHVVQQRGGVALTGGVGSAGDVHERHADAVADAVVRGESVEALLEPYASDTTTSAHVGARTLHRGDTHVVQRCADTSAPPEELPALFNQSGFHESSLSESPPHRLEPHPDGSEMEHELSRLSRYAMGYMDRGRSMFINVYLDLDDPDFRSELEQEIRSFVERFVANGTDVDRERLVALVSAYVDGYAAERPEDDAITDNIERQHGGYNHMAALLAEHTGRGSDDPWRLTSSAALMQFLHDMGYWADLDRRVVEVAETEYSEWTDDGDAQCRQRSEAYGNRTMVDSLERYWRAAGRGRGAHRSAVRSSQDHDGFAWSAAFVSYVMMRAGAADTFDYGSTHTRYARTADRNRRRPAVTHPSRLFNARSEPVHIGGLMHRNRPGRHRRVTFDDIRSDDASHVDIVVNIEVYDKRTGERVAGDHREIIERIGSSGDSIHYDIFAVTIGGNTIDQDLEHRGTDLDVRDRSLTDQADGSLGNTVGRRYWKLHPDLTLDIDAIERNITPYGIQRLEHPPRP